jgi:regulator of protease activity HflC (stomatin/prohibitin superfamily)
MYYLNKQLIARNIIIEDYLIKRISLPEIVSRSIEKKMVAEQLSYEFDYKLLTEEKERRRKLIEAEGIRAFEEVSQIPILKWKGLEVTSEFARSSNSKIIIMGTNEKDLPLLLNTEK